MQDPLIDLRNVSVGQPNKVIISNITFTATAGEFIYLIGKVGSGKSTLLKSLYAELPLLSGEATFGSYELHNLQRKQIPYLRRKIGIVFQDFQLLTDRTVRNNLLFVLEATGWKDDTQKQDRIAEVLTDVDMLHKIDQMPHRLSGGEQQRICIARALLNQPAIILADEPTGNLDPQTADLIMSILIKLSDSGKTVIMATHNYNLIKKHYARILKCADEKIVEVVIKSMEK